MTNESVSATSHPRRFILQEGVPTLHVKFTAEPAQGPGIWKPGSARRRTLLCNWPQQVSHRPTPNFETLDQVCRHGMRVKRLGGRTAGLSQGFRVLAMAAAAMATMRVQQACSKAAADELPTTLPPAFLAFLKQNGLDASIYAAAATLPRYVRVKPQASSEIPDIEQELGLKLSPLPWLPSFFSLPPEAQIASTLAYQQGKLYGMDAASGAAVAALEIASGDHVLDLCAAPGAKLCMMAEFLGDSGSLTAVDIARPRLAACRTMLRKYELGRRTRLYLGDGTSFSLLPLTGASKSCPASGSDDQCHGEESRDSSSFDGLPIVHSGFQKDARMETTTLYGEWRSGRTRQEKRAAKRAKYLGIPLQSGEDGVPELFFYGVDSGVVGMKVADVAQICCDAQNTSLRGYDKVLVDAECTHDGSLKHITKYEQWGWETFERRFLNEDRIASVTSLQLRLLSNGFRLLNPGGTLVYSTCSFTKDQNEGVVERFLATHDDAGTHSYSGDTRVMPFRGTNSDYVLRHRAVQQVRGAGVHGRDEEAGGGAGAKQGGGGDAVEREMRGRQHHAEGPEVEKFEKRLRKKTEEQGRCSWVSVLDGFYLGTSHIEGAVQQE